MLFFFCFFFCFCFLGVFFVVVVFFFFFFFFFLLLLFLISKKEFEMGGRLQKEFGMVTVIKIVKFLLSDKFGPPSQFQLS